jgi:hypothetical protein
MDQLRKITPENNREDTTACPSSKDWLSAYRGTAAL